MQRYSGDVQIQEINFTKTPFWVQVHDIPMSFLTWKVIEKLCETVEEIQKSTVAVDDEGGNFF